MTNLTRPFLTVLTVFVLFASVFTSGCYTMEHTVGEGAQSDAIEERRQWFVLFGLVPINEVDSAVMADGSEDYTITTEHTFVDVVIGLFTGIVSVYPKTVRVTK